MQPGTAHNKNLIVTVSVFAGVLVTLVGLVLSGTLAVKAGRTQAMNSRQYSDSDVEDTRGFWDQDRQDEAKPRGAEITPGRPAPELPDQDQQSPVADYRQPPTIEARRVASPYTRPEVAIRGKIFFRMPEGVAECSGTVVHHPSGNMVWTAAHCLHGGRNGDFYDRVTFVPGYNGAGRTQAEREPYGRWPARRTTVSNHWAQNADPNGKDASASPYDYGAFIVDSRGGRTLEEAVGPGADVYWNAPRHLRVQSFGYPGDTPYDGTALYTCSSPTTDFREDGWPQPDMLWMGCTMTGGSSGGGWFTEVDGQLRLVSNVSLGVTTPGSRTMTGPYLGDVAKDMYDSL
ncbi:trypsin-like serine peptidase [Embleya sp. NPDC056575]|uniref:trypsin-like serine peptidase n=1 Tax=unclassified Embleya TaxID=2699296 RepID=UPI0036C5146E